ncbi:hypothetical protein DVH05_010810 [Phytophthora capsici]|nr:hypothetical protein DVH05_010810 [Phytophthora capsici]
MTPPSAKMDDSMRKISPLRRPQCCRMQTFKRAGILLAFHLLNVLVAIGGIICVALLLASMLLMPIWLIAVVIIVFVASILDVIQHIENKCLKYCAYAVVVILYLASLSINWYMTVGPYAVVVVGVSGVVKFLMKIDVILVNFVAKLMTPTFVIPMSARTDSNFPRQRTAAMYYRIAV